MFNGKTYFGEKGYMEMMADALKHGVDVPDRTGVGSRAMFDAKVIYQPDEFPFSTFRPASLEKAYREFWFFMSGRTQTKEIEEQGVPFWVGNTTREFLDNRGLKHLEEGDMGMAYGWQWRSFNKGLVAEDKRIVDQLKQTYETLKNDPFSRRVYTTFWNPSASPLMALTPCWHSHQFVVLPDAEGNKTLHLKVINRSLDILFGYSFAVQQYRLYQMCMAKLLGYELGGMVCDLSQHHIYHNQFEYVKEALTREQGKPGKVRIKKDLNTLDDVISLQWEDIEVTGLEVNTAKFKTPRPPMAA